MTANDLCLICVGFIFNGLTFALGLVVGAAMKIRKDD